MSSKFCILNEDTSQMILYRDINAVQEFEPGFTGDHKNIDDVKKFLLSYFLSSRRWV